ncbi:hypothetical protein LDENG_00220860 [Lucifuga dentata]|nr:hypothetical protein LDENG_00220860 [Lucifuga dentata]
MGHAECNIIMESKRGSGSAGHGSPGGRGQSLKSSSFCPRSSSRLAQSIIKDQMVSHYKKVYSAKDNDQLRQERLRKGGRPQSAHSLSQSFSRASCLSTQSRLSLQDDRSPFLCSRSSMISSPRFSTSFPVRQTVYPSAGSQRHSHAARSSSELSYRGPEATSHQQHLASSSGVSGNQSCYKTFQDPVQKTYSGDLLQKHSQQFTQNKPFTPKTLKSDKSSYLSKYRYYRAPRRKPIQDSPNPRLMRQETYHGSTQTKEFTSGEFDDPSQGFSTEHKRSEDEFSRSRFSASRQQSQTSKSIDQELFNSSSRVSPEGRKSPFMMSVSAEEEELMYLEFISAVTDDILCRGYFSDRALDRLLKQHSDMNRHQLDEDKMRHLLEMLRKALQEPSNTSFYDTELEKKNYLHKILHPQFQSEKSKQMKTKENDDLFSYASLIKHCDSPEDTVPLSVSTPSHTPERTASPMKTNEKDWEDVTQEQGFSSHWFSEHATDYTEIKEEESHQNQVDTTGTNTEGVNQNHEFTTVTSGEGFHQHQAEVSCDGSKELEDLGKSLSESLHVSSNTHNNSMEAAKEQHTNTFVSPSDEL